MSQLLKTTVVALAASLALAGCSILTPASPPAGNPDSTQSTESGVAPATGPTITGNGYSFSAPEGWGHPETTATPANVDTFAGDLQDTDGFVDNINVLLSPAGEVTPDQIESLGVKELEDVGAENVKAQPRITVAGSESAHLSALFTSGSVKYQIEQYYASHNGQTYIVTFSFSESVAESARDDIASSVLSTWLWV
jgi:hypothetical protein